MTEGSVVVDEGSGIPGAEESTSVEETNLTTETEGGEESRETETTTKPEGEDGEKQELTDKGTKLDPNPQSAVHQQLANANKRIQQMEQVLGNPELLKNYAAQSGMTLTEAKAEIKEEKKEVAEEFSPDSFKTAKDVAKGFNAINKTVTELRQENQRLRDGYKGINSSREAERVVTNMGRDITAVQEKYPELNPKDPSFNKELESSIGELYNDLDFDPQSKTWKGKVSVIAIADQVMKAAGLAKKQGSRKAQTDVKVKQAGKVTSGKSKSSGTAMSSDPGTMIAQKINKAVNG